MVYKRQHWIRNGALGSSPISTQLLCYFGQITSPLLKSLVLPYFRLGWEVVEIDYLQVCPGLRHFESVIRVGL